MSNTQQEEVVQDGAVVEVPAGTLQTRSMEKALHQPGSMEELNKLANWLAGSGFCPDTLRNKPKNVMHILMKGQELGLSPIQSLDHLQDIKGRISMSAELMRARAQNHPQCDYLIVTSIKEDACTIVLRRKDWPEGKEAEVEFTIEDAKKAGLVRAGGNWTKFPKSMVLARCTSLAVGAHFPEARAGLMTVEEARDLGRLESAPVVKGEKTNRLVELLRPAETIKGKGVAGDGEVVPEEPSAPDPEPSSDDPKPDDAIIAISASAVESLESQADEAGVDPEEFLDELEKAFGTRKLDDLAADDEELVLKIIERMAG